VPLVESEDAIKVNWCELTVTDLEGEALYLNGWVTDFQITDQNVASMVAASRARCKFENENNNTLKTNGYHLEHIFGHGKQHLTSFLATMNIAGPRPATDYPLALHPPHGSFPKANLHRTCYPASAG